MECIPSLKELLEDEDQIDGKPFPSLEHFLWSKGDFKWGSLFIFRGAFEANGGRGDGKHSPSLVSMFPPNLLCGWRALSIHYLLMHLPP